MQSEAASYWDFSTRIHWARLVHSRGQRTVCKNSSCHQRIHYIDYTFYLLKILRSNVAVSFKCFNYESEKQEIAVFLWLEKPADDWEHKETLKRNY